MRRKRQRHAKRFGMLPQGVGDFRHRRRRRRGHGNLNQTIPTRHRSHVERYRFRRVQEPHRRAETGRKVHGRKHETRQIHHAPHEV